MDVKLPPLGEGADSGTVVSILVKEGDQLARGQTILELETGKAVAPIPSSAAGKITRIYVREGAKASVGTPLLALEGDAQGAAPAPAAKPARPAARKEARPAPPPEDEADGELEMETEEETGPENGPPPPASPSLRRLARDLGINLRKIRGSENGGRIVLADLRTYIHRLQKLAQSRGDGRPAPAVQPVAERIDFSRWGPVAKRPMTPLRKVISQRMAQNWVSIPHVTQFDEIDITPLMELRKKYAAAYEKKNAHLTLTGFALKAVVETLKKHPVFNSSLDESTQEIVYKEYYDIGVAVDTEQGLIVPVIRGVDKKNLVDLSRELSDLAAKARERKVGLEEMQGGTFTISNQGGIGGAHFTPIVNRPEVAILGLGRGALKAVVRPENKIESRLMLPVALSYDHRVIDGGSAARFMVDLGGAFAAIDEAQLRI